MMRCLVTCMASLFLTFIPHTSLRAAGQLVVVVGIPGEQEFEKSFREQAKAWETAGSGAGWNVTTVGLDPAVTNDLAAVRQAAKTLDGASHQTAWIVFIGHGSFDGKAARFNLRGPDLVASDLAEWLRPVKSPLIIVNTASSSAPFINQLSGTNRVIITATRSGHEQNYTRFGRFMAEAIQSLEADLDKDEQVSLLEAFLFASRRTAEFYKVEGRIATEHALLDDNGDALGTPAEWYQGLRPNRKPQDHKAAVDGLLARQQHLVASRADSKLSPDQIRRLDELERGVLELREKKTQMPESEYYSKIERILLELAGLYQTVETN